MMRSRHEWISATGRIVFVKNFFDFVIFVNCVMVGSLSLVPVNSENLN
jgi:hypothetical protein